MEYQAIRVTTLRGDQKLNFDAYMKVADKMILYIRRGESFEGDRLKRLKDKKLKKMYIIPDHEVLYREYLQRNIEIAYDEKSGRDITVRAEIVQGQQQNNIEEVFEHPELAEAYYNAKDLAGKYMQFLLGNSKAVSAVMAIENSEKNISHHGVNVAAIAVALAQKLGMIDPKQNQHLTLGALLHDFGHYETSMSPPPDLTALSPEELTKYQSHPVNGASKLQDKRHFEAPVLKIIQQHEELVDGTGFPFGLRESQMDPLAILVSTANAVDRMMTFENVPRDQIAKRFMTEKIGRYPLNHIQLLADILKA
ncbi:MAG: HD domain-containing phosphohydrolase [Bdellovibrionota bacterium]